MKHSAAEKLNLPAGFHQYYGEVYGERWPQLFAALLLPERQVVRWSAFTSKKLQPSPGAISWLSDCYWRDELPELEPERDELGLLDCYIMDPASVLAARALPVQQAESVLDLCAAPGGKSLILMEATPNRSQFVANEPSPHRRERLKKVLRQYIPDERRAGLSVKGVDGIKFGKNRESFDSILLDAPCSGERHLLHNQKEREAWSLARSKGLSRKQSSLLGAGFSALKPGGYLLYSTCSISPLENDEVLARFAKKKAGEFEWAPVEDDSGLGERTEYGIIFLPDRAGFGPLFYSLLRKNL